ncbi:hypothetical protein QAD02_006197 [Eretmocerus hayati]|uniref:Uncharacterized protein n=1 Tax=Eretmocerus hayati TaxID=131215 RepID=A0ACC2N0A2_9HYME|nr:hypothetical protein QAD02_006197 [Eretmocerus hayati]
MSLKSLIGASAEPPSGTPTPPALNPALPPPPSSSATSSSGTEQTAPSHSPMDTNTQEDGFETVTSRKAWKRRRQQNSSSAEDSDSDSSDEESATAGRSPPPIVICDILSWPRVQQAIASNNIGVRRAFNTSNGVRVFTRTTEDFRTLTQYLESKQLEYTTHQLHEDRELVVVIRGVNQGLSEEQIKEELSKKIPSINRVHRMKNGEKIWPLVAVHLDKSAPSSKTIFVLESLCGLSVKVEAKRKSSKVPQCSRCQKFNHTHNYCHAAGVCAFCSRDHATPACRSKDDKQKKPTCSNCKGEHRATYRGCPKAPKKTESAPKQKPKPAATVASRPPPPPPSRPANAPSYARAASRSPNQPPPPHAPPPTFPPSAPTSSAELHSAAIRTIPHCRHFSTQSWPVHPLKK